jgi:hypothetical protein
MKSAKTSRFIFYTGIFVLGIFLLGGAFACGAQKDANWIRYNSTEGRYSVLFPGKPELTKEDAPARTGEKLAEYFAICTDPDGGEDVVYMTAYFDLAPNMGYSFDESRDGMLKAANATLQSEKKIQIGGYEAREIKASGSRGGKDFVLIARFVLVDKRVYLIEFVYPKTFEAARAAEKGAKFFDSFALTNSH